MAITAPPGVRPIKDGPFMRRLNGFGTSVVGSYPEPLLSGGYYKQFVITAFFIPVLFGTILLVTDAAGRAWYFHGKITGREFVRRFGWKGYTILKATAFLESGLFLIAFILAVVAVFWIRKAMRGY